MRQYPLFTLASEGGIRSNYAVPSKSRRKPKNRQHDRETLVRLKLTVPVAPFRDEFLRQNMSKSELARRIGWNSKGSTHQVAQMLGLLEYDESEKAARLPAREKTVRRDTAHRLCRALHVDPLDFGL